MLCNHTYTTLLVLLQSNFINHKQHPLPLSDIALIWPIQLNGNLLESPGWVGARISARKSEVRARAHTRQIIAHIFSFQFYTDLVVAIS